MSGRKWDVVQGCTTLATIEASTAGGALRRFRWLVKYGQYFGPTLNGVLLRAVPA